MVQTVIPSFFGGQAMITMATFAYIADVSSVEMRTLRIGIVQIVLNICVPVAQGLSGILFVKIGYIGVLIIAGCCYLLSIIYCWFYIREPKKPHVLSITAFLKDALDPKHAMGTFTLLLKKSPGYSRISLVLLLLILFIYSLVSVG